MLSRSSLEALVTPGLDDYGFGLWIDALKVGDKTIVAYRRPGQIMGAQSMLIHYQGADITIIVLSNGGTTSPDDFAFAIGRKLLGQPPK
jgi:D-alanyl-D-alanine carboxypeptidase